MKKIFALLLTLCMVIGLLPTVAFADDAPTTNGNWINEEDTSWYNTTATEFTIDTAAKLAGLAKLVNEGNTFGNKKITLGADIDLEGKNWTPIGTDSTNSFKGEFDGNSKTISNLTDTTDTASKGLFGYVYCGYVHNLTLTSVYFSGAAENMYVGALAAQSHSGAVFKNITLTGATMNLTPSGMQTGDAQNNNGKPLSRIGGLFGRFGFSQMKDCAISNVNITANGISAVGGFAGAGDGYTGNGNTASMNKNAFDLLSNGEYPNCYLTNATLSNIVLNVTNNQEKVNDGKHNNQYAYVGGFYGLDFSTNGWRHCHDVLVNSTLTGLNITCSGDGEFRAGGVYGMKNGETLEGTQQAFSDYWYKDVSVSGSITSTANGQFGGFAGRVQEKHTNLNGVTTNVNISAVSGYAGGLIGYDGMSVQTMSVENCVVNGSVTCTNGYAGGLIGYSDYTATPWSIKKNNRVNTATINGVFTDSVLNLAKEKYLISDADDGDSEVWTVGDAAVYATKTGIDKGFTTIQEAVDAGAETVTLLKDVTEDFTLKTDPGKSFPLTLGSHVLNGTISFADSSFKANGKDEDGTCNITGITLTINGDDNNASNIVLSKPALDEHIFEGWCKGSGSEDFATATVDRSGYVAVVGSTYHTHWAHSGYPSLGNDLHFNFGTVEYGYDVSPAAQSVTFTSNASNALIKAIAENDYFTTSFEGLTATVQPKEGLTVGTYVETIHVTLGDYSTQSIIATIIVKEVEEKPAPEEPKPDPKPSASCDHSFDANDKCKYCGIIVIDHTTEKADDESNPNTGAESAIGVAAAVAALSLAGIAVSKKK